MTMTAKAQDIDFNYGMLEYQTNLNWIMNSQIIFIDVPINNTSIVIKLS